LGSALVFFLLNYLWFGGGAQAVQTDKTV
jgi:hypothetical protein